MAVFGGADEVVIRAVHPLDHRLEARHVALDQFARGQPFARGGLLDLLAVLVGAGQEIHVIAVEPLEARDRVGRDRFIGVTDMRHAIRIGDRGGDVDSCGARRSQSPPDGRQVVAPEEALGGPWPLARGTWRLRASLVFGLAVGSGFDFGLALSWRPSSVLRPAVALRTDAFFGSQPSSPPAAFLLAGPPSRLLRRPLLAASSSRRLALRLPFGRSSRSCLLARALIELLRAPAASLSSCACFDFDVFAMDHSAVSICGSDNNGRVCAARPDSKARAISRLRHRQGGRMPEDQWLSIQIVDVGARARRHSARSRCRPPGPPRLVVERACSRADSQSLIASTTISRTRASAAGNTHPQARASSRRSSCGSRASKAVVCWRSLKAGPSDSDSARLTLPSEAATSASSGPLLSPSCSACAQRRLSSGRSAAGGSASGWSAAPSPAHGSPEETACAPAALRAPSTAHWRFRH